MADETNGEGTPTPEPTSEQNDAAKFIAESKKYRERAQKAEAELNDLRGKVLSDEDREAFAQMKANAAKAEEELLKKKGDYEAIIQKKTEEHTKQLEQAKQAADAAMKAFAEVSVQQPLMAALAAKGVKDVSAAGFLLQGMHAQRAIAELVDGKPVVKVVDRNGVPVIDADCNPGETISVAKMVDNFLATPTGQAFLAPSGDSGSGSHGHGGMGNITIEALDKDPQLKADYIQKEGREAYLKLASQSRRKQASG